jgi:hypothetical protein
MTNGTEPIVIGKQNQNKYIFYSLFPMTNGTEPVVIGKQNEIKNYFVYLYFSMITSTMEPIVIGK